MSGFGTWTSWDFAQGAGKSAYIIPESGTVLTHVNAVDLHSGTAKVGGAWTLNGSVTYNAAASPRPSVGPFSDTNYYSQPSSPANVGTVPFTAVEIIQVTSFPASVGAFVTGAFGVSGYGLFMSTTGGQVFAPYVTSTQPIAANQFTLGALSVLMFGVDASNTAWAQLNNGTAVSATGVTLTAGPSPAFLGRYTSAGFSLNGTITELMVSTAIPSAAAFTTIYNQIIASE